MKVWRDSPSIAQLLFSGAFPDSKDIVWSGSPWVEDDDPDLGTVVVGKPMKSANRLGSPAP